MKLSDKMQKIVLSTSKAILDFGIATNKFIGKYELFSAQYD